MPDAPSAVPTMKVTGPLLHPSPETVATYKAGTGKSRKQRRRKGGWPARTGLTRQEVEDIRASVHAACTANRSWRPVIITLNPDEIAGETDAARKRRIEKRIAPIGQALKRRGQPQLRLTVWQKPPSGRLHAHVWVLVNPKNDDALTPFHHAPAVMVQPWKTDPGYLTRERLPNGPPEWEMRQKWRRCRGQPIRGSRLSIHADLKSLVHEVEVREYARPPQPVASAAVEFSDANEKPQLALFALPAAMPHGFDLAAERQRLGLSQRGLASLVGLKQPHIANCERGHDKLSPARLKAVRHVLQRLAVAA